MVFEWDPDKDRRNIAERGIPFQLAESLEWERAAISEDVRRSYPEIRYVALVPYQERLYVVIFARGTETNRLISLRLANSRERKRYEKARA